MLYCIVNRINQTSYFENIWILYYELNILFYLTVTYIITLFDVLYRHTLNTSFRYTLDVNTKHGIRTLRYSEYINMSSKIFSRYIEILKTVQSKFFCTLLSHTYLTSNQCCIHTYCIRHLLNAFSILRSIKFRF